MSDGLKRLDLTRDVMSQGCRQRHESRFVRPVGVRVSRAAGRSYAWPPWPPTTLRSIFGMPGVVSLMPQLMMTSGVIRKRGEPFTCSMEAPPMTLIPRGAQA